MTTFVKSTEIAVTAPILASTNAWYGENTFLQSLVTKGIVYEMTNPLSGSANAYTLNYTNGGIYYLPSAINPSANSTLVITNIPTSTQQTCTITVVSYQASTRYYISQVKVQNTASTYLWGSSGAFAAPLFNGGTPSIPGITQCVVVQQFTMFPMNSSWYVMSSVSACS